MLKVTNLTKSFPGASGGQVIRAVDNVSFAVQPGAFFTLLGPSGCGKTTLLRCVAGLEQPDSGEIWIGDNPMFSAGRSVPSEARPIAMVFQSYAIWPHMTVFDNAAFPLIYGRRRVKRRAVRPRVMDMLDRVGLSSHATSWATQLSGGQQQRLALARALLCDPEILLLDEPLSNLDARLRADLRQEIKEFQRSFGVTTIYVTHDQAEALSMSDHVAVVHRGVIQQMGTPQIIYSAPSSPFVASFLGNANLVTGKLISGGPMAEFAADFGVVACCSTAETPAAGKVATLCVRPEDVHLHAAAPRETSTNVFAATVRSCEFLGDRWECTVGLAGTDLHVMAPSGLALAAGDSVWAELPPTRAVVLAAGAESSGALTPDEGERIV